MAWRTRGSRLVRAGGERSLAGSLAILERALLAIPLRSTRPQVFILGLPRSGTTLVYQYLVHRLDVAYFTNRVGRFPRSPCAATLIDRSMHRSGPSDFKSHYGHVAGPLGPREAGAFWARTFGFESYVGADDLSEPSAKQLYRTITALQALTGDAVFVNKNVKHQLRIAPLARLFPDALFLRVGRDLPSVALSILRGRHANLNDPKEWWSVKPPGYEGLRSLSVTDQVAQQVLGLEARMDRDLRALDPRRVLDVDYGHFCDNPEALIRSISERIGPIAVKHPAVSTFPWSRNRAATEEEAVLLDLLGHLQKTDVEG